MSLSDLKTSSYLLPGHAGTPAVLNDRPNRHKSPVKLRGPVGATVLSRQAAMPGPSNPDVSRMVDRSRRQVRRGVTGSVVYPAYCITTVKSIAHTLLAAMFS